MLKDTIKEQIMPRLGKCNVSRKGWHSRNCMLCAHRGHSADKRGRFGLVDEPMSIGIHCFNCRFKSKFVQGQGISKDFIWFMETIGVPPEDIRKLKFQAFREKDTDGSEYAAPVLSSLPCDKWAECKLPENSMPIQEWLDLGCTEDNLLKVAAYAKERGVSLNDAMWSPVKMLAMTKRMILPFRYNGKIVGYTGRLFKDNLPSHMKKYINVTPDDYIYNMDAQCEDRPFVILYEGALDAYLCDGISPLGTINETQAAIINSMSKRVIVCPDRDKEGQALIDMAVKHGWEVSIPAWEANVKDAGQAVQMYGKILTIRSILDRVFIDKLRIKLNRRKDTYNV